MCLFYRIVHQIDSLSVQQVAYLHGLKLAVYILFLYFLHLLLITL